MTTEKEARRVRKILACVKRLAAEYYQLTGKPLGVTGEVAEYVAAEKLGLDLAGPRTPGYDATRRKNGKTQKIQIKGRAYGEKAESGQRLGRILPGGQCEVVLFVLLDNRTLEPREMWEARMEDVRKRLAVQGSKARARGVLGVSEFKKHCRAREVWPAS